MIKEFELLCQNALNGLDAELQKIRTGRAHPGLLDGIHVNVYGQQTPLKQLATIGVQDSRTLSVTPWDKNSLQAIQKSIQESDLGLNPNVQSDKLLIAMPVLTEERRKELVKIVRAESERCKVVLRHHRRDVLQQVKLRVKQKELTEDDEKRFEQDIDKTIDKYNKLVDAKIGAKEKELLAV